MPSAGYVAASKFCLLIECILSYFNVQVRLMWACAFEYACLLLQTTRMHRSRSLSYYRGPLVKLPCYIDSCRIGNQKDLLS